MMVHLIVVLKKAVDYREVNFQMVSTGWAGGHYGTGSRIKLANTQSMAYAALDGKLEEVVYTAGKSVNECKAGQKDLK
jgi:ATP-dependent phosphoenolpyruvate carboxykinase